MCFLNLGTKGLKSVPDKVVKTQSSDTFTIVIIIIGYYRISRKESRDSVGKDRLIITWKRTRPAGCLRLLQTRNFFFLWNNVTLFTLIRVSNAKSPWNCICLIISKIIQSLRFWRFAIVQRESFMVYSWLSYQNSVSHLRKPVEIGKLLPCCRVSLSTRVASCSNLLSTTFVPSSALRASQLQPFCVFFNTTVLLWNFYLFQEGHKSRQISAANLPSSVASGCVCLRTLKTSWYKDKHKRYGRKRLKACWHSDWNASILLRDQWTFRSVDRIPSIHRL